MYWRLMALLAALFSAINLLSSDQVEGLLWCIVLSICIATAEILDAIKGKGDAAEALKRYREALERLANPRNTHFAGDARVVARQALQGKTND